MKPQAIPVSIIVPVYNVEKYLPKCLKSILEQTMSDFELILVNDASPDKSLDICRDYSARDNRIIIIDKNKNEGVDKARFDGLNIAKGEYVCFVDSDDWMPRTAISKLYNLAIEKQVDLVIGNIKQVGLNGLIKFPYYNIENHCYRVIEKSELMDSYFMSFFGYNILPCNLYGRIYRRSLFADSGVTPCYYRFGEDIILNMKIFPFIKSIYLINDTVYYYRMGSGVTSKMMSYWMDTIKAEYIEKKATIAKYNYNKAYMFISIELLNSFKYYIEQFFEFVPNDRLNNIRKIANELEDPIYLELKELNGSFYSNQSDLELINLIGNRDAEGIYNQCEYNYTHRPLKLKFRSFVRHMIGKFL